MTRTDFPAVVTAAGAATRFQPFAATVPKEMLPLGPTPAVEHVIRECLGAGATDVIVVTRPGDTVIPAHVQGLRAEGLPVETVAEDLSHGYRYFDALRTYWQPHTDPTGARTHD